MTKHVLPELPYALNALEPHISAETMEFHYGKHHNAYVQKLNQLIEGTEFENQSLEEIIARSKGPVFNNAAQIWNHTFFWNCLTPDRQNVEPGMAIRAAIDRNFGSLDRFEVEFKRKGTELFGSGWVWLVHVTPNGKLAIESTSNAETPLQEGKQPILTCDLWEHAYYIDYRNERARFLDHVFPLLNWAFAEKNYTTIGEVAA